MRRSLAAAALGLSLCLAGGAFGATTLFVPGVALPLLAGTATGWVWPAGPGARLDARQRHAGARRAHGGA